MPQQAVVLEYVTSVWIWLSLKFVHPIKKQTNMVMFKGFICLHLLLFFLMIIFLHKSFFGLSILNQHREPDI